MKYIRLIKADDEALKETNEILEQIDNTNIVLRYLMRHLEIITYGVSDIENELKVNLYKSKSLRQKAKNYIKDYIKNHPNEVKNDDSYLKQLQKQKQNKNFKDQDNLEDSVEALIIDAETLFMHDEDHLDYEFIQHMGYPQVGEFDLDDIKKMIRRNPEKAAEFIREYIN